MEQEESAKIIRSLYRYCLKREAGPDELKAWTDAVQRGMPISRVIDEFGNCDEYRNRFKVVPFFAPGHYHSPIVSPDEKVRAYMCAQDEACMLDSSEEIGITPEITCIEPYADRLKSLLRPADKVEILESPVQYVSVDRFKGLEKNDILFIDSTHVLKSGSDVHYELFEILPVLKSGVYVHFHDLMYPFEYPPDWVFDTNYSWNEAYAVRAFLMYNRAFAPFYSSSLLLQLENAYVKKLYPDFPANPGTNLWIVRID